MRTLLVRNGSMPILQRFVPGSTKASISRHNSAGEFSSGNGDRSAFKISLNVRSPDRSPAMRRALSERMPRFSAGFMASPVRIPEEEEEEMGNPGDGGSGDIGGEGNGNRGGGYNDKSKIGEYYREMLKSEPNNPLLLMNYGRFLYEVEKDAERAEEYYGRAILESGGNGEALSMYGKLIWETQRDEGRAKGYFEQALNASPHDCMVLGSYAQFMWEADGDEDEDGELPALSSSATATAF